jgi:selT/selW/selH-like putative selenoprotein
LAEEGIAATATPGSTGQFDVIRDGTLVFSKKQEHRFPEHAEVLAALR